MTGDPKQRPSQDTRQRVDSGWVQRLLQEADRASGWNMRGGAKFAAREPSAFEKETHNADPRLSSQRGGWGINVYESRVNPDMAPVDSTVADHAFRAGAHERRGYGMDPLTPEDEAQIQREVQQFLAVNRRPLTIPSVKPDATRVKSIGGPKR